MFSVINRFKTQPNTLFKGVRVELGEGENTVSVRFQERSITAAVIDDIISSLRKALNEDQATVAVTIGDGVEFANGFDAKEFAKLAAIQLKPGDITQSE